MLTLAVLGAWFGWWRLIAKTKKARDQKENSEKNTRARNLLVQSQMFQEMVNFSAADTTATLNELETLVVEVEMFHHFIAELSKEGWLEAAECRVYYGKLNSKIAGKKKNSAFSRQNRY